MTKQDLRQRLINIIWKYDTLSEGEVYEIVNKIMKEINEL